MTTSGEGGRRIFISYRRDDTAGHAGRLYDRLVDHYGDESVFMDLDSIEPGTDFVEAIERAVRRSHVLLVVVGAHWAAATDENGERRLEDPTDFVRLEIESALALGVRVIPVLVEQAVMPKQSDLPAPLSKVVRLQSLRISNEAFRQQSARLIETIDRLALPSPSGAEDHSPRKSVRRSGAHAGRNPERVPRVLANTSDPVARPRKKAPARPGGPRSPSSDTPLDSTTNPEMILIPGGEFTFGTGRAKVVLPEFWIGRYPVTNAEYDAYVRAERVRPPRHWSDAKLPERLRSHPVTWVSLERAIRYCSWLSTVTGRDYRLPTDREWEKAARGADGRRYPWGEAFDRSRCHVDPTGTAPVTEHSPRGDSPFGVADMVGNVREWTLTKHNDQVVVKGGGPWDIPEFPHILWCGTRETLSSGGNRTTGFRVTMHGPTQ